MKWASMKAGSRRKLNSLPRTIGIYAYRVTVRRRKIFGNADYSESAQQEPGPMNGPGGTDILEGRQAKFGWLALSQASTSTANCVALVSNSSASVSLTTSASS